MQLMDGNSCVQHSTATSLGMGQQEEALHSICKQFLKSKFFRGYYEGRLFVDAVNDYRDIISLHCSECELERVLLDIKHKLQLFYQHSPEVWIGITHGACMGIKSKKYTLDTHIWVQLKEAAFGEYWLNMKNVRFRKNEVLLKLKIVRALEYGMGNEGIEPSLTSKLSIVHTSYAPKLDKTSEMALKNSVQHDDVVSIPNTVSSGVMQIGCKYFVNVMHGWGTSLKYSLYNFLSNDINKDNISGFLRFLGLFVIAVLSGSFLAIKYLGNFTIRFMFEFTRFTQIMTPIIVKLLEVISKVIGGFYIIVAIIWKDIFPKRKNNWDYTLADFNDHMPRDQLALEYPRPMYKSIQYKTHQVPLQMPTVRRNVRGSSTEFERKFQ